MKIRTLFVIVSSNFVPLFSAYLRLGRALPIVCALSSRGSCAVRRSHAIVGTALVKVAETRCPLLANHVALIHGITRGSLAGLLMVHLILEGLLRRLGHSHGVVLRHGCRCRIARALSGLWSHVVVCMHIAVVLLVLHVSRISNVCVVRSQCLEGHLVLVMAHSIVVG